MPACDTLERVARLLDQQERERFFAMIARFRNLPEDDEYLQILEAIGFMTLIWSKVPAEVAAILDGANPVQETCLSLEGHVRRAVESAIPSQSDLRQITQLLNQHDLSLKQAVRSLHQLPNHSRSLLPLTVAFLLGMLSICALSFWFCPRAGIQEPDQPLQTQAADN